jgi:hypothetical protein
LWLYPALVDFSQIGMTRRGMADVHRKYPPLDLRSKAGKALLRLTKEQFAHWEAELRQATGNSEKFVPSHSMHYWYLMSTLALDGDKQLKLPKKTVHDALPRAKMETGRKYLEECEELGLTYTIKDNKGRYAALTDAGERALANTLGRWIVEFAKARRDNAADVEAATKDDPFRYG